MRIHRKKMKTTRVHAHRAVRRIKETHAAKFERQQTERRPEKFSKMETGQVDRDEGRGPLGQEGEGERQNDQLAELERMMPESSPPYRRGRRSP